MPLLVRKIDGGKWLQNDICNGEDVSADAITICMKTQNNTLSTWLIENEAQLDKAVLAIVSNHQHLDSIDVTWFGLEQLIEVRINIEHTPGITPIPTLVDSHVNLVGLNYRSLGNLADLTVMSFNKERVRRYTRGMLKKLLQEAIDSGQLRLEAIALSIASKLG